MILDGLEFYWYCLEELLGSFGFLSFLLVPLSYFNLHSRDRLLSFFLLLSRSSRYIHCDFHLGNSCTLLLICSFIWNTFTIYLFLCKNLELLCLSLFEIWNIYLQLCCYIFGTRFMGLLQLLIPMLNYNNNIIFKWLAQLFHQQDFK